jgi:hypothetical protein
VTPEAEALKRKLDWWRKALSRDLAQCWNRITGVRCDLTHRLTDEDRRRLQTRLGELYAEQDDLERAMSRLAERWAPLEAEEEADWAARPRKTMPARQNMLPGLEAVA